MEWAGQSVADKLAALRPRLAEAGAGALLVTMLGAPPSRHYCIVPLVLYCSVPLPAAPLPCRPALQLAKRCLRVLPSLGRSAPCRARCTSDGSSVLAARVPAGQACRPACPRSGWQHIPPARFLAALADEVAWLFNLRGSDVPYNPVFISYGVVTAEGAALYVDSRKVTPE